MMNEYCDLPNFNLYSDRQVLDAFFQNEINAGDFTTLPLLEIGWR